MVYKVWNRNFTASTNKVGNERHTGWRFQSIPPRLFQWHIKVYCWWSWELEQLGRMAYTYIRLPLVAREIKCGNDKIDLCRGHDTFDLNDTLFYLGQDSIFHQAGSGVAKVSSRSLTMWTLWRHWKWACPFLLPDESTTRKLTPLVAEQPGTQLSLIHSCEI